MGVEGEWREDDAYALVRRAAPYAALAREDFDAVLDYLSETSESLEERRVYAKLEREGGAFRARGRSVQTIFYQNVGTIAGGASVRVKRAGPASRWARWRRTSWSSSSPATASCWAAALWSFLYAQGMTAFVAPAGGRPSVPRWASEVLPATAGVALGVGELRAWLRDQLLRGGEGALADVLARRLAVGEADARAVASYVATQDALSPIPDPDEVLIERWVDPEDDRVLVHAVTSPSAGGRTTRSRASSRSGPERRARASSSMTRRSRSACRTAPPGTRRPSRSCSRRTGSSTTCGGPWRGATCGGGASGRWRRSASCW
jgi:ATP-dependent Lhr-like helicase